MENPQLGVAERSEREAELRAAQELVDFVKNELIPSMAGRGADQALLSQLADTLETCLVEDPSLSIGFVGQSQVGKSSLVNALLGARALPAGGLGPLTARATRTSWGERGVIDVEYHKRQKLWHLAFALEIHLTKRGELRPRPRATEPAEDGPAEAQDPQASGPSEAPGPDAHDLELSAFGVEDDDPRSLVGETMLGQARLMLQDSRGPRASNVTLHAGLLQLLGHEIWDPRARPETLATELFPLIQSRLGKSELIREDELGGRRAFKEELKARAAGFLSPIVSRLKLQLDVPWLRGLELVDLPGIGVVGDPAALAAEDFVKGEGDVLVVVMRNNGLTDDVAMLLERTGVMARLLFSRPGETPIRLVIVVTHLDLVARERYAEALELAEDEPAAVLPQKDALFEELAEAMARQVRDQLQAALLRSPGSEESPEELKSRRAEVIAELCERLEIFSTAATDAMALRLGTGDSFLQSQETTGIPELQRCLIEIAREQSERASRARREAVDELRQTTQDLLYGWLSESEAKAGRSGERRRQFVERLESKAKELRELMAAYHDEVRDFLEEGLPLKLDYLCLKAKDVALTHLESWIQRLQGMHVRALSAALVRQGAWQLERINLPVDVTRVIVEAIAGFWQKDIVDEVQRILTQLVLRDSNIVETLGREARDLGPDIVDEAQLEYLERSLPRHGQFTLARSEVQIRSFQIAIQRQLSDLVAKPIARACKQALKEGQHKGPGARERIIETFLLGGRLAIEEAGQAAKALLREEYRGVRRELQELYLSTEKDPIRVALTAVIPSEESRPRDEKSLERLADLSARFSDLSRGYAATVMSETQD